jgi:hypothetical protein
MDKENLQEKEATVAGFRGSDSFFKSFKSDKEAIQFAKKSKKKGWDVDVVNTKGKDIPLKEAHSKKRTSFNDYMNN